MRAAWLLSAVLLVCGVVATRFGNGYQLFVLGMVAVTAIAGTGLNVLLGLAGQISLGHAAFYAIGAYTAAVLATRFGVDLLLGGVVGAVFAAAAGALLSLPAVRVRGPYLAMVTIAFGFVVEQGAAEWKTVTGGWNGLGGIPKPSWFGHAFSEADLTLLCVLLAVIMIPAYARFTTSRWGLVLRATRDAEVAAQSLGANLVAARTLAFAISAALTGLAGALFAALNGFISPESFPFFQSIVFLLVVLVGGVAAPAGPPYGALVVGRLPELLSFLAEYRLLFFGGMLLLVLLIAPSGLAGAFAGWLRRLPAPRQMYAAPVEETAAVARAFADLTPAALRVESLTISFGGNRAVSGVSLTARPGQITSLIGPNGAGKTTLLNLVSGFYRPDAGAVMLGETALTGGDSHRSARAGVARTFQTTQLFAGMTVGENLAVAALRGRLFGGSMPAAAPRLMKALLQWVGYTGAAGRLAGELPHVDRRLVEIARALAARPAVLLLDEPAAGLSADDTRRLGEVLKRIAALGIAVVIVEHDMQLVMAVSDRVYVLDAGALIAEGDPAAVQASAAVRAAYLGDAGFDLPPPPQRETRGQELLAVQRLTTGYGAAPVLDGVSLHVKEGELIA